MDPSGDGIRRLLHSPLSPQAVRQAARDRYPLREPVGDEVPFFASNPGVAGYAAPPETSYGQRTVVLNPSAPKAWGPIVHANEGIRHYMYEHGVQPEFDITPTQQMRFEGYDNDAYAKNADAAKQTIVARILSGDHGMAPYTQEQSDAAQRLALRMLGGE